MVFEVLFFFASLTALGLWLFAREYFADWRRAYRARRVQSFLDSIEGRETARAEALLGPADEIIQGMAGRRLYVWKGPVTRGLPSASTLLIITLTVDAAGIITHAACEER